MFTEEEEGEGRGTKLRFFQGTIWRATHPTWKRKGKEGKGEKGGNE